MLFRVEPLRVNGEPTDIDCQLPAGVAALQINNIAVVLFESVGKLLPFSHPLWWASIFSFRVNYHPVYEGPIHRFVDPVAALALNPEQFAQMEPECIWRYIGKINGDFTSPYQLSYMENAKCRIAPRCFPDEKLTIPPTCTALVILDGKEQRNLAG